MTYLAVQLEQHAMLARDIKEGNVKVLDYEEFCDLVLHCHFVTRP